MTKNLRDFPSSTLQRLGIEAKHPDDFLASIYEHHPGVLIEIITDISRAWTSSSAGPEQVINSLAIEAPSTASSLRDLMTSNPP